MRGVSAIPLSKHARAVESRTANSVELLRGALNRIQETSKMNWMISRPSDAFLKKRAEESVERIAQGKPLSPLDGLPVVVKDNFCTEEGETTAASNMLRGLRFHAQYDAGVVSRLNKAGCVVVAKSNLDEFAMGSSTTLGAFGPTLNPWGEYSDTTGNFHVSGGSSGGSAAAVSLGVTTVSVGSDTGGSVRLPASFCGVVGFKPSYGYGSRFGLISYASSLDTPGVFGLTVMDAAMISDVIYGYDANDSTSIQPECGGFASHAQEGNGIAGLRIGIPREYNIQELDSDVRGKWEESASFLEQHGAEIVEVSLEHTEYAIPVYQIISSAECSSNLARYDGIRYGPSRFDDPEIAGNFVNARSLLLGKEVKRRILVGALALSRGNYDEYFGQAQKVRRLIDDDFTRVFNGEKGIHAILTPSAATSAFESSDRSILQDPARMMLHDVMTIPANLAGLPALSVPVGLCSQGMPIGMQVIAPRHHDGVVFRIAKRLEESQDHRFVDARSQLHEMIY